MQEIQVGFLGWEDPLEKEWLPIPVFLPGEFHGQRSSVGYSPWGHRVGHEWVTNTHTHTHTATKRISREAVIGFGALRPEAETRVIWKNCWSISSGCIINAIIDNRRRSDLLYWWIGIVQLRSASLILRKNLSILLWSFISQLLIWNDPYMQTMLYSSIIYSR